VRTRVVLACQQDRSNREVARQLNVATQTAGKWRAPFVLKRLDCCSMNRGRAPRAASGMNRSSG
jgi:transposase